MFATEKQKNKYFALHRKAQEIESHICRSDLSAYRSEYVHALLESEKGELSELENEVLESLQKQELISAVPDSEFEHDWTCGRGWYR